MFSNSVKLFTFSGIEIRADPSWLILAGLITWSLSKQYFPSALPDQMPVTYLLMGVVAMLLFFASLLMHEMVHSVVARSYGVPVERIYLFIFGGVAELESEPRSARIEFWVALAGPVMSLCLALGFWFLATITRNLLSISVATEVFSYLALINLVLAVFNMIPAFPLDGGRILRAYLWHRSGDLLKATRAAAKSGMIFAYTLMVLGLLTLFQGATLTGLWQILLGGFVLFAAQSGYQSQRARILLKGKKVKDLVPSAPITVTPDMTLSEFVDGIILQKHVNFVPVMENGILLGHMDKTLLSGIDRENWADTHVGDVFEGLDPETTIDPDLLVTDLLHIISRTGQRKFLVVDDHDLIGVLTLADVTHLIQGSDT